MDKQEQSLYDLSVNFNEKLFTLIQQDRKERKYWMIALIFSMCVTLVLTLSFIWYLNQYDFSGTIEVDAGSGNAYYQDGKGNTINGDDQSCKETNQEK